MDRVKKVLHLIKENINLLILIPTVLGGFWQLIELVSMDVSFVRFFSITQVVSDGLIILFLLSIYLVLQWMIFSEEVYDKYVKSPTSYLSVKIVLFLFYTLIYCVVIYKMYHKDKLRSLDILIFFYTSLFFLRFTRDLLTYWLGDTFKKNFIVLIFVVIFPITLFYISDISKVFHKLYYVPSNIKNIEYIECYTGKKKKDFELLYFNDKYVFIKDIKSKQIEIINFEEMLNKDNCK